jgi:hypothetical protein
MDIDEALQKRLQDFESILEATQNVSYDEPFKWQGKNYNSFRELIGLYRLGQNVNGHNIQSLALRVV